MRYTDVMKLYKMVILNKLVVVLSVFGMRVSSKQTRIAKKSLDLLSFLLVAFVFPYFFIYNPT